MLHLFRNVSLIALALIVMPVAGNPDDQGKGNAGGEVPSQIDELADRVEVLEGGVGDLQLDLSVLQTDLGAAQRELTALSGQLDTFEGELDAVDLRLLDLEDGLEALAQARIVFVTETSYTGNLGGLEGADAKCQSSADSVGLEGTFLAWISTWGGPIVGTPVTDPASRFIRHNVPYVRVDGVKVADHFADLADGTLDAPINRTEFDTQLFADNRTWSTTAANGRAVAVQADTTCENWTTDALFTTASFLGTVGVTGFGWSSPGLGVPEPCGNHHRLLCVQQ